MGIAYLLARVGVYSDGFHVRCFLRAFHRSDFCTRGAGIGPTPDRPCKVRDKATRAMKRNGPPCSAAFSNCATTPCQRALPRSVDRNRPAELESWIEGARRVAADSIRSIRSARNGDRLTRHLERIGARTIICAAVLVIAARNVACANRVPSAVVGSSFILERR
jgi:hypothetical protein